MDKKNKYQGRCLYDMWIKPVYGCDDVIVLTNGKRSTDYAGRPPGNSPEFMPMDNTLNQDIHAAVETQVSCTYHLPHDDEQKFSLATPKHIEHAYGRVFCPDYGSKQSAIPSNNRIVQDINKTFFSFLTVMKAKGKVVPGLASRKGHRAYIHSLTEEKRKEIVVSASEELALIGTTNAVKQATCTKCWLHPDTLEVFESRCKQDDKETK